MFKKAEKNELKTWLVGSVFLFLISAFVTVILVASMVKDKEFRVGATIFSVIFAGVAFLFAYYIIGIVKAYKSFDSRKADREAKEKAEKEEQEAKRLAKIEEEAKEIERIKAQEEEKARINQEAMEQLRKEREEQEKNERNN